MAGGDGGAACARVARQRRGRPVGVVRMSSPLLPCFPSPLSSMSSPLLSCFPSHLSRLRKLDCPRFKTITAMPVACTTGRRLPTRWRSCSRRQSSPAWPQLSRPGDASPRKTDYSYVSVVSALLWPSPPRPPLPQHRRSQLTPCRRADLQLRPGRSGPGQRRGRGRCGPAGSADPALATT